MLASVMSVLFLKLQLKKKKKKKLTPEALVQTN